MASHGGEARWRLVRRRFRSRRRRPEDRFEAAYGTIQKESARVVRRSHPGNLRSADRIFGNDKSQTLVAKLVSKFFFQARI